jgi:release factor glutamine methyltransferase
MTKQLWQPLTAVYGDEREARAVMMWLLDVVFHLSTTDVVCGAVERLSQADRERLEKMTARLMAGEPVQYVAGVADFGPHQFFVCPDVLIPRPETYALCQLIANGPAVSTVLDIGTGSGCIACTLALDLPGAEVTAWDISEKALLVAGKNAKKNGSIVTFEQVDALCPPEDSRRWDLIVSNPPYICEQERADMAPRVLQHEPPSALFVPDDDPLRFYRAITRYAVSALRPGGRLFFELNTAYAQATADLVNTMGMKEVTLHEDPFGRIRFLRAVAHQANKET